MTVGRRPAWGALLVALGLGALWWVGVSAARYMPAWGEAEPQCVLDGSCARADVDAALRDLWWGVAAGGLVVLLGTVLVTRGLSPARPAPTTPPRGVLAHAGVAGLVAGVLAGVLGVPALVAVVLSPHAVAGALLTVWAVSSAALATVDRALGTESSRRAWLTALAMTPLAAMCAGLLLWPVPLAAISTVTIGVAYGAVVAAGVALLRSTSREAPPAVESGSTPVGRPEASTVVVGVLTVVTVVAVVAGVQTLGDRLGDACRSDPPVAAPPPTDPRPVEPPLATPSSTPTPPPPARVEAARPCAAEDLSFAVPGFDAAMGARGAVLQATNVTATPCWVEGVPVVTLLQGGRPLQLTVLPGQDPSGGSAVVQRVGLAAGESAVARLTWRTYAGWADAETPQTVTATLDAGSPAVAVAVTVDFGPAPFDIADGGEWEIAPWARPWT